MATTSPPKPPKHLRFSALEVLGFADTPYDSSARTTSRQHTALVSVRPALKGKHVRRVEEIWDSTELHTDSLVDWEPTATHKTLNRRVNFRWSMLFGMILVAAGLAGLAYWLYQRPTEVAETAIAQAIADAGALDEALAEAHILMPELTAAQPDVGEHTTILFDLDDAARDLFSSAAELPNSEAARRSPAADAAGLALDGSRLVGDALAYRTVLAPALAVPDLETNPALVNITTAAQEFSTWRSYLTDVAAALPEGVASEVTLAFIGLINNLEAAQNAYIDALRLEDEVAASDVITVLASQMEGIHTQLMASMEEISQVATTRLEEASARLDQLLG